jgi:hypothetical protein
MGLNVRNCIGRYPHRGIFRSENIVASVQEIARVFRVRLDDEAHPDAYLEVTIEVDSTEEHPQQVRTGEFAEAG